jgi:hypothetical protein
MLIAFGRQSAGGMEGRQNDRTTIRHYGRLTSDMTMIPPNTASATRSAAAERMRRYRERRRKGLRCLMIQLRETEVDALICQGLLKPEMRNDPRAVRKALYGFLDGTLGAAP